MASKRLKGRPLNPIRDAVKVLMGGYEPPPFLMGYDYANLTSEQEDYLEDWAGKYIPTEIAWSDAGDLLDFASAIVHKAVVKGYIPAASFVEEPPPEKVAKKTGKKSAKKKR